MMNCRRNRRKRKSKRLTNIHSYIFQQFRRINHLVCLHKVAVFSVFVRSVHHMCISLSPLVIIVDRVHSFRLRRCMHSITHTTQRMEITNERSNERKKLILRVHRIVTTINIHFKFKISECGRARRTRHTTTRRRRHMMREEWRDNPRDISTKSTKEWNEKFRLRRSFVVFCLSFLCVSEPLQSTRRIFLLFLLFASHSPLHISVSGLLCVCREVHNFGISIIFECWHKQAGITCSQNIVGIVSVRRIDAIEYFRLKKKMKRNTHRLHDKTEK